MSTLTNSPRTETVLALEARKSFALGLKFLSAVDGSAVDITGCAVRLVVGPKRGSGAAVLSKNASLLDAAAGVSQFELQAAELDLPTGEYPFTITLTSALQYSTVILKGVVEILANPDPALAGPYSPVSISTNLDAYLSGGTLVEVKIASVDGLATVINTMLDDAADQAEDLVEQATTQAETATASAVSASASAVSAAASAALAGDIAAAVEDPIIAAAVDDPASETRGALDAVYTRTTEIDSEVTAHVNDAGSSTQAAVDARVVTGRNVRVMYLDDQAGVATNGVTECAAAIQAAINAAEAANLVLVAGARTYVIGSTLTFKEHADFSRATLSYSGATGTAVVIGDTVNGITRQVISVGRVVNTSKVVGSFTAVAGSIGVRIADANKCAIYVRSVTKFETGVELYGHARGVAYNEIRIGELASNKVHMRFATGTAAGYTNGNQIYGGSWNHDQTECGGTNIAGTRHVLMTDGSIGPVADTNTFYGCSFEGNVAEFFVESYGKMNTFRDCRWEATTPKAWWRTGSFGNAIRDGYKPELITVTNEGETSNVVTWPASGDISEIFVPAPAIRVVNGTGADAAVLRHPTKQLSAAASDVVAISTLMPPNWHTYDVEVHFTQTVGVTSSNVTWLWRPQFATGEGETLVSPAGGTARTVATPTPANVVSVDVIETSLVATPGRRLNASLIPGAGTFANTVHLLGVVLRRRS